MAGHGTNADDEDSKGNDDTSVYGYEGHGIHDNGYWSDLLLLQPSLFLMSLRLSSIMLDSIDHW